ncbi:geranylgeranylglycerol-phosphate geranylgeranyltransferase [Kovacikia minuta CCNUW1]|uniref:geranylgeranylglycerol-phosphate geranylgeranyltransferase n=1 Tax=Kovacikia minuta TaxID=2931930 RepID=UPI001CCDA2FE|nr:geranylgeranylglycerol-phosphate geranylgeranyltransferase [Kovacikia minuta]UBF26344.1 geranylgeranylglycerol-phosphate geranylgeranyltransferase [Kovacikia minuta CCNUW1]
MATTSSSPNSVGGRGLVHAFAHLFRLPVPILAALAGCATLHALNPTAPWQHYSLLATVLACMYAAACVINDYWDVEKDRIDHPERPLPSGQILLPQAYWIAVLLFAAALIAAVPLGVYSLLLVAIATVLLWYYSHILTYSGILGNGIVAAIVAALIFLGSLVAHRPFAMLYPTGFLFCYSLAKEIIWDIHDAVGDRQQGVITLANRWGDQAAFGVAWGLIIILLSSIPIALFSIPMTHPLLFAGFSAGTLLSLAIALLHYQHQRSETAYQKFIHLERLSMLLGVMGLLGAAPCR